ncbi:MAG: hypothetical protein IPP93_00285 [Chitinophagaceae bacterium]|nr:hypothetical protein [Chitinophagaceae bacterium]
MRKIGLPALLALFCGLQANSQLTIDNATFFIQSGATVTVQGDITSNVDIQGPGTVQLKGSSSQNVNMNGFTIPNLTMDNAAGAVLTGNVRIGTSLLFTTGKITIGNFNFTLSSTATTTGAGVSSFIATNGTGQLRKELSSDVASFLLPVGEGSNYRPAFLTTSGSAYASANFGVKVLGAADATKPLSLASYLNTNWPVTRTGITGGTVSLSGQYIDPDVVGTEANLVGYYTSGTDWTSAGETHNAATNQVGAPVTAASGVVSGMNKFVLVGAKAFLQGAYDANTLSPSYGLMAANLRTLPFGSSAVNTNFPSTDPYRVAPYNTYFSHVNNTNVETIPNSGVIGPQALTQDDIVDWVFLQLRDLTPTPGNVILQTRSALIQRDGDIVDVDGYSPVTFNGIANGSYILTVRHRNHLGLSIDQASPRAINEAKSTAYTANVIDLRTATDPQLFGTTAAYTTATHPVLGTVNLLWGGNANGTVGGLTNTRFTGLNNDRDYLLLTSLGGVTGATILNVYHPADVNLNKIVRFTGLNNDRDIILLTVLGGVTGATKTQAIPN